MSKEQINNIDWDVIDGTASDFTETYPRIQWNHGKEQFEEVGGLSYTGGFFIPKTEYADLPQECGFKESKFKPSKGDAIQGWYAPKTFLSVIRIKQYWTNDELTGKGTSHTLALVTIKGCGDLFQLSLSKQSKGGAFFTAFQSHLKQIVSLANRNKQQGKPNIEPFGLWCVIQADKHSQEQAKNSQASSEVTRPMLFVPPALDLNYVRSLWVGTETYLQNRDYFNDTKSWQNDIPKNNKDLDESAKITDATLKTILDLMMAKDVDETLFVSNFTIGKRDRVEFLLEREALEMLEDLRTL